MKFQFFFTLFARVSTALGGIGFNSFVGRTYGAEGLGVVGLCQTILIGLAVFGKCGLDRVLIKYISTCDESLKLPYLWKGTTNAVLGSTVTLVIFFILWRFKLITFSSDSVEQVIIWFLISLIPFSLCYLLSGYLKGLGKITLGCLFEQGVIAGITALILFLGSVSGHQFSLLNACQLFFLSSFILLLLGIIYIFIDRDPSIQISSISKSDLMQFNHSSFHVTILNLFSFGLNLGGILIAGFLLSSEDLGYFRAAERLCLTTSFVLAVINSIYPPRFARNWAQGKIKALKKDFFQAQLLSTGIALPITLLLVLFPSFFLQLFLESAGETAYVLQIAAISSLANACSGPVGNVLTMTGHEKEQRNIIAFVATTGLVTYWITISQLGLFGAVVSYALVSITSNLLLMIKARSVLRKATHI